MNIKIPDHIASIKSYQPGKTITQLQEEYGWNETAILWNNENTLGYSPKSKQAVIDAYVSVNYYPDPVSSDLKKAIAERLAKDENQIIVGNGSESVLMLAIRAICHGDDEFLTSEGGFVIIYNWAKVNNIRCVTTPMTSHYGFDLEALKKRINRNTKVIYLANCNNPTGTKLTKDDLTQFLQNVPDHVLVIIDEAYFEFSQALDPEFPDSLTFDYPNILTLRTYSKAYGIAGVRLGYGIADEKIIEAMSKTKLTFEPTGIAQAAGLGALNDHFFLQKTINNNTQQLQYFYNAFEKLGIKYIQSYGNFVMTIWKDADEVNLVFDQLLQRGVLVRPLMPPLDNCIRVSVGRPEENKLFFSVLEDIMSEVSA